MALEPVPAYDPVLEGQFISNTWYKRLSSWLARTSVSSYRIGGSDTNAAAVARTSQGAAIVSTPIPLPSIVSGHYRLSLYATITQQATTSSALTVTLGWTDRATAKSLSASTVGVNPPTTTVLAGSFIVRADAASPFSYATTYTSAGVTPMLYDLDVVIEAFQ
jgi:hypothetical protein